MNGQDFSSDASQVSSVTVNALADDDTIWIADGLFADFYTIPTTVDAGDGNDQITLLATRNVVSVIGGAGDDQLTLTGDADYAGYDGGDGVDMLLDQNSANPQNIDLRKSPTVENATVSFGTLIGNGLNNVLRLNGSGLIDGGNGDDQLTTAYDGNCTLLGGAGNDRLQGGSGNDTLDGGLGADFLSGGTGFDTVDYSSRTAPVIVGIGTLADDGEANEHDDVWKNIETVIGGSGNDTIKGSREDNLLIGNGGSDLLIGLEGSDTLDGGPGKDTLDGGAGSDFAINPAGDVLISIENSLSVPYAISPDGILIVNGTDADDTIQIFGNDASIRIVVDGAAFDIVHADALVLKIQVNGGDGNDNISFNITFNVTPRPITISGNGGSDTLRGGSSPVLLLGGTGNDSLYGGSGNDTLDGGTGADLMKGGGGNDTADYSSRTKALTIGLGTLNDDGEVGENDNAYLDVENVLGGSGNDFIRGSKANNLLVGNGGDDTIFANFGDDTLSGDTGTDSLNGESGIDTATNSADDILFSIENNQGGGAGSVVVTPQGTLLITGTDSNDTIAVDPAVGGKVSVALNQTTQTFDLSAISSIEINANGGSDVVTISAAITEPATLRGGAGNDSLVGGGGNDLLDGGAGADIMKGGAGNDTADYSSRTANLTIGIGTLSDDGEAGEHDNVNLDIETVLGGSGNDSIKGGAGNNLLIGNGGNDTLRGNWGNDTLSGDAGTDILDGEGGDDTATNSAGDILVSIEHLS